MNEVKRIFNLLPFTWSDSYSKNGRFYIVDLALPLVQYPDTLRYLQLNLGYLSKEINLAIIDPSFVSAYTLPHHMFIEGIGWKFEKETIIKIFKPLVKTLMI
jgi:hypothetical protein